MAQQTAIEWFYNNLLVYMNGNGDFESAQDIYKQAKAMEKEQIITAMMYHFNETNTLPYGIEYLSKRDGMFDDCENYYNETYNK